MHYHTITQDTWNQRSLVNQMAQIGAEIGRAMQWKSKKNTERADTANIRALELLDLTISDPKNENGLKELTRARELWLDFFLGDNRYQQTAEMWEKYFLAFNYAARIQ